MAPCASFFSKDKLDWPWLFSPSVQWCIQTLWACRCIRHSELTYYWHQGLKVISSKQADETNLLTNKSKMKGRSVIQPWWKKACLSGGGQGTNRRRLPTDANPRPDTSATKLNRSTHFLSMSSSNVNAILLSISRWLCKIDAFNV